MSVSLQHLPNYHVFVFSLLLLLLLLLLLCICSCKTDNRLFSCREKSVHYFIICLWRNDLTFVSTSLISCTYRCFVLSVVDTNQCKWRRSLLPNLTHISLWRRHGLSFEQMYPRLLTPYHLAMVTCSRMLGANK